jgi:hypothetical protein
MPTSRRQSFATLFTLLVVFPAGAGAFAGQQANPAQTSPSASGVISGAYFNPLQVGLLSWFGVSQPASFSEGGEPYGLSPATETKSTRGNNRF